MYSDDEESLGIGIPNGGLRGSGAVWIAERDHSLCARISRFLQSRYMRLVWAGLIGIMLMATFVFLAYSGVGAQSEADIDLAMAAGGKQNAEYLKFASFVVPFFTVILLKLNESAQPQHLMEALELPVMHLTTKRPDENGEIWYPVARYPRVSIGLRHLMASLMVLANIVIMVDFPASEVRILMMVGAVMGGAITYLGLNVDAFERKRRKNDTARFQQRLRIHLNPRHTNEYEPPDSEPESLDNSTMPPPPPHNAFAIDDSVATHGAAASMETARLVDTSTL